VHVISYEHVELFCFVRYYLFTIVVVVVSAVPRRSTCSTTHVRLSPFTLHNRKELVVNWCFTGNWTFHNIRFLWLIGTRLYSHFMLLFIVLIWTMLFVFLYFGGQMWQSVSKPKPQYFSQFPVQSETIKCKSRAKVNRLDSAPLMLDSKDVDDRFPKGCKWNSFHLYIHVTTHLNRFLSNNQPDALIIQIYSVIKLFMFRASTLPETRRVL
jgi:hypothetical protein